MSKCDLRFLWKYDSKGPLDGSIRGTVWDLFTQWNCVFSHVNVSCLVLSRRTIDSIALTKSLCSHEFLKCHIGPHEPIRMHGGSPSSTMLTIYRIFISILWQNLHLQIWFYFICEDSFNTFSVIFHNSFPKVSCIIFAPNTSFCMQCLVHVLSGCWTDSVALHNMTYRQRQ